MTIKMTATYSDTWWESDEPDTDPCEESGYTDPSNPWGGFRYAVPDGLVGPAFVAWRDENAETVTFDNVTDAALFALDFPGGVWDFGDPCEPECVDYSTGRYREVTLHVTDGIYELLVFAEMDRIESGRIEDVQRAINGSNPHGGDVRHSNVIRDANGALYEPWQGPNGGR